VLIELVIKVSDELSWGKQDLINYWKEEKKYKYPKPKKFGYINSGLQYLKDIGVKLAIISSRDKKSMLKIAEECGLNLSFFSYIQGNGCHDFVKPDKRVFDKVEEFFVSQGMTLDKFVYIGDTVDYDYQAARNRGFLFVAVASSFIATPTDFIVAGLNKKLIYTDPSELCLEVDRIIKFFVD
jgi:FMN phosphatase YigB (HAD superfamily)